ncbi:MAG: hypothetical protein JEZ11_13005 [Desulfobacterales bacterium]|nr:hypothetical protein [Desulfobacterales bacterium]
MPGAQGHSGATMRRVNIDSVMVVVLSVCLLACHFSIFLQFFPNRYGYLGHDYAFFLPALVDGFCWFKVNGLWAVPWFTPSFSGGALNYIDLQRAFYTLPQFLGFVFEPVTVLRITFGAFSIVGYVGFYLLLRQAFRLGSQAALLGACLFLFNGFYAHRMIVGHFGASPFMLLPVVALVLMRPLPLGNKECRRRFVLDVIIGGLLFAYMVQTWFALLMIPGILAVISVGMLHGLLLGGQGNFWRRLAGAGVAGMLFSASKLVATAYLMGNFDRSGYLLPGTASFPDAFGLMVRSLFISPVFDPDRMRALTHVQWFLDRHEWEFGVTPVPLLILVVGAIVGIFRRRDARVLGPWTWPQWGQSAVLAAIVVLPAALNTYIPEWNQFLKQVPFVKSSSALIRWFFIPLPLVIVASALMVDRLSCWRKYRTGIVMVCIAGVVWLNAVTDRGFYHRQFYDPRPMASAFRQVASGAKTPRIRYISAYLDGNGRFGIAPVAPNDMFVQGGSPMLSYDPFFGYRHELFPLGALHPGPVMDVREGQLNIKNPACYVWPEANRCLPGGHFTVDHESDARAFVNYRPFGFSMPMVQKIANLVNILSLALAMLWLTVTAIGSGIRRLNNRRIL